MNATHAPSPFSLPTPSSLRGTGFPLRAAEHVLGLARLNRLYLDWRRGTPPSDTFIEGALEVLEIGYSLDDEHALGRIPRSGPLVVVANHPHGAADGLVLTAMLRRVRGDVRLLGNRLLARIPELVPLCVFVDVFGSAERRQINGQRLVEATRWLGAGGALVVFPAGEVSHRDSVRGDVRDPAWREGAVRLAAATKADVLPVHIAGANSAFFQLSGLIHPRLRTAMLARELLRQRGRRFRVSIGDVVAWSELARMPADVRTSYLRVKTYRMATGRMDVARPLAVVESRRGRRIVDAVDPSVLQAEIEGLGTEHRLLESGVRTVLCAPASLVPNVLREIGRLREMTFRAEGEGTGHASDLDHFDRHYRHLFLWDSAAREIVGAYRVGLTDAIGASTRPSRLYTRTLFRYGRPFVARLDPALELGRSFIRPERQRDVTSLLLLWKGIGQLVAQNPRYRYLFGPVSMSASYHPVSRDVVLNAFSKAPYRSELASLVWAKRPVDAASLTVGIAGDAGELTRLVDRIISEIERRKTGMPVLLRHYVKLGAQFLAFSTDPAFSNVMDALVVVDLTRTDPTLLQRYLGPDGAATFLAHHSTRPEVKDAGLSDMRLMSL